MRFLKKGNKDKKGNTEYGKSNMMCERSNINSEKSGKCIGHAWMWGAFAGIVFLGIGAAQNHLAVIWQKAVMICMECIGIG